MERSLGYMKKYFQLHDYSYNQEANISIFNLQGKAYRWWEKLKQVEGLEERKISWKIFQKYFKQENLLQQYYDKNIIELFELQLGNMTMDEYENRFLELLSYVDFIREDKVRIQHFLSGLLAFYKEQINYDEPLTLKECIRKAKFLYEQGKNRKDLHKRWKSNLKTK